MHIRGDHTELVVGGRLDVHSAADARMVLHSAVDTGPGSTACQRAHTSSACSGNGHTTPTG